MNLSKELIERLENITSTDYSFNSNGETDKWDIIVEDLISQYEDLLEEYNDYKTREEDEYPYDNYHDIYN